MSSLALHTIDNWCHGRAAARGKWVGPTLICHSSSNSPHMSLSGCWELITNGNNNHKRNIIQIKDRLAKRFASPFIILKVRGPVRHKQILRRNKDNKNQRDVLQQINMQTDRGEAKQLWEPWRIYLFFIFKRKKRVFPYGMKWCLLWAVWRPLNRSTQSHKINIHRKQTTP